MSSVLSHLRETSLKPKYCISWKQGHPVKLNINPRTFHPFKKAQRWRFFAPKQHTICCKKSYILSTWLANLVGISQARTRSAEWKGWEAPLSKQPCKCLKLDRFPSTHFFKMNMIFVFSPIFGRFNLFEDQSYLFNCLVTGTYSRLQGLSVYSFNIQMCLFQFL